MRPPPLTKHPKGKRGANKKKTLSSKRAAQDDGGGETGDDDGAALAPTQTWVAPTAGGDSDSAGASSAAVASQKNKKKDKGKEKAPPARTSQRANGEAAPGPDLEDAKSRRKACKAETKGSSAAGTGALNALASVATAASGAEAGSAGAQGDGDDGSTPSARVSDRPDLVKKAGHKNRANQEHAYGVWTKCSPTGVEVGEKFCKENFEHSDGRPWAILVFNAVTHKVPKKPQEGAYYPSSKDRPRFYERYSRAIAYVPRIAPFRSNIDNIDLNQRMFPSEHTADPTRFAGTLLLAVNLVWFLEKDHASKLNYAD